jgi:hypothetical protein
MNIMKMKKFIVEKSEKYINDIEKVVKVNTPVKTGKLKNSFKIRKIKNGFLLENKTKYGGFVELGTHSSQPRYFVRKPTLRYCKGKH